MVKIYHNNRCRKSRLALKELMASGLEVEVIEYLKTPLDNAQLRLLVAALDIGPYDLIRRGEKIFKEHYKKFHPDKVDWIQAMVDSSRFNGAPYHSKERACNYWSQPCIYSKNNNLLIPAVHVLCPTRAF